MKNQDDRNRLDRPKVWRDKELITVLFLKKNKDQLQYLGIDVTLVLT
jgi:hypothetical protein